MASKNVGSTFRRTAANKKTFAETHTDTVAPTHTHTHTHTHIYSTYRGVCVCVPLASKINQIIQF